MALPVQPGLHFSRNCPDISAVITIQCETGDDLKVCIIMFC